MWSITHCVSVVQELLKSIAVINRVAFVEGKKGRLEWQIGKINMGNLIIEQCTVYARVVIGCRSPSISAVGGGGEHRVPFRDLFPDAKDRRTHRQSPPCAPVAREIRAFRVAHLRVSNARTTLGRTVLS